jgi:hypothetical protein
MNDPGNESSPGQGAALNSNIYDEDHTVLPSEVEAAVDNASVADLLCAAEPTRDRLDCLACHRVFGWWKCPACGERSVEIADCANAWCAACGWRTTRWSLGQHVLADADAVHRIAAGLKWRKELRHVRP